MKYSILFVFFLVLVTFSKSFSKISSIKKEINPRIIGGQEATPHSIPYQAFLIITAGFLDYPCGGILISQNYILTTAGCALKYSPNKIKVRLGVHNITEVEETQEEYEIKEVIVHENYSANGYNDIAVLRLPKSVRLTPAIRTISLPRRKDVGKDYVGALATTSGWGIVIEPFTNTDVLNFAQVKVISNEVCASNEFYDFVNNSTLCTSRVGTVGVVGICGGDFGGPLVTDGVLIGISSFSSILGCDYGPGAFTKVSSYLDWLSNNTDAIIN